MVVKKKVGKQRRDKAYWAAKEIGYRSRASFKLIQLNRKWEFLQKSNVCIDLCAAPGSWMQVAKEHMPMSSLVVGVDLVAIKPIAGCIALTDDITTEKCRANLRKELQNAKADLVLHDGAPNVGKNWIHDAFQQSLLTLHAFKLASEFLAKNGTFVTKVFRSKDYQSLIWVLGQFFKKVHATKPAASRNESAEIFVVCMGYSAPDKIDPNFFDPRHVFSEVQDDAKKALANKEIVNPEKGKKKPAAEGYEDGNTGALFKEANASDFIMGDKHVQMLNFCNRIVMDTPRVLKHKKTTNEVVECCKDLKVLGMKDLRLIKKWRDALRKEFEEADKKQDDEEEVAVPAIHQKTKEEEEDEELAAMDKMVDELKDDERRKAKRLKKKELKEKQKRIERLNMKMIIPGDEGLVLQEDGLFKMSDMKTANDVAAVVDQEPEMVVEDSDDEGEEKVRDKYEKYEKGANILDSQGLWYAEGHGEEKDEEESDSEEEEDLGLEEEEEMEFEEEEEGKFESQDALSENPLMEALEKNNLQERRAMKANAWFEKAGLADLEEDSDVEDEEVNRAVQAVQKKGGTIRKRKAEEVPEYNSDSEEEEKEEEKSNADDFTQEDDKDESDVDSDSDSDLDSDDDDLEAYGGRPSAIKGTEKDGFEVVPQEKAKKRPKLNPEELALGEQLIQSKKARRDIMDGGWHRFMNDDDGLPDWFVKEEEMHMKKRLEVDPATVDKYKDKDKEINVKTIKKVVEAKARRKRKVAKRMDRAKKKAAQLLDNEDIGSRDKMKEISKMYKKAKDSGKKKEVSYVVAKKHNAGKRAQRPTGIKGPYKQVDPRMKCDTRVKRGNANDKRVKKRRMQGKQVKPTKQFNTNTPKRR